MIRDLCRIAVKLGFFLGVLQPLRWLALLFVRRGADAKKCVLIVQLDNLGDVALALGSLRSAIASFPSYEATLIVDRTSEAIARQVTDRVIAIDRRRLRGSLIYAIRTIATIKRIGFDTLLHHTTIQLSLADYYSLIALSGATRRIGYEGERIFATPHQAHLYDRVLVRILPYLERVYTILVPSYDTEATTLPSHVLHHYEQFLTRITPALPFSAVPQLSSDAPQRQPYAVIGLGAAVAYRRWPVERFADVTRGLQQDGLAIVLVGVAAEAALGAAFMRLVPDAENRIGMTSLNETLSLIQGAGVVVCNETAFVHLAVALKRPVACVLGGGHYGRCSLHGYASTQWVHVDVGCDGDNWACGRSLPNGSIAPCIDAITADHVLAAARSARTAPTDSFHLP